MTHVNGVKSLAMSKNVDKSHFKGSGVRNNKVWDLSHVQLIYIQRIAMPR